MYLDHIYPKPPPPLPDIIKIHPLHPEEFFTSISKSTTSISADHMFLAVGPSTGA